jgi:hypothetical protein
MLRASRSLLVCLLAQLHAARTPLLLRRGVVHVMPPVAVLLHDAVSEQTVNVTAVAGQAVVFAPALAGAPVRAEGVWPMRREFVIRPHLHRSDAGLQ